MRLLGALKLGNGAPLTARSTARMEREPGEQILLTTAIVLELIFEEIVGVLEPRDGLKRSALTGGTDVR